MTMRKITDYFPILATVRIKRCLPSIAVDIWERKSADVATFCVITVLRIFKLALWRWIVDVGDGDSESKWLQNGVHIWLGMDAVMVIAYQCSPR
jgi:hypothetical protein